MLCIFTLNKKSENFSLSLINEKAQKSYCDPCWDQITLVEDKDQMLMPCLRTLHMCFNARATSSLKFSLFRKHGTLIQESHHGVSGIQHLHNDVGRVEHFIELSPDALALAFLKNVFSCGQSEISLNPNVAVFVRVVCFCLNENEGRGVREKKR